MTGAISERTTVLTRSHREVDFTVRPTVLGMTCESAIVLEPVALKVEN